jgi:hypothetical protein
MSHLPDTSAVFTNVTHLTASEGVMFAVEAFLQLAKKK